MTCSLEESYVHELRPYSVHCSLLPEQRKSIEGYFTFHHKYNLNSLLPQFNALCMEHIRSLRTGIMAEYMVMSTSQGTYDLRLNRTNVGRDEIYICIICAEQEGREDCY